MYVSDDEAIPISSENISQLSLVSTSPNTASSSTLSEQNPRRSIRIASKSPRTSSRATNVLGIHRTISDGVSNSHSPKLSNKRRSAAGGVHGDNSQVQSQFIIDNDNNIRHDNNYATNLRTSLPSDQSDDESTPNNTTSGKAKQATLATRKEILSYFQRHPDGYKCNECKKVYRASKFSDTNLRKHLASNLHNIPNVLYKSQIDNLTTSTLRTSTIPIEKKKELHTAAINAIIQDGLPFDTFQKSGMSQFLSRAVPGYRGPHRKTVRNRIAALYSNYTIKLKNLFPKLGLVALTSDLWKSPRRTHFISLTAHVFNEKYENIPIILGCRRIIGPHTAATIEKYLNYELHRYGIKRSQIVSITTDSGSNMKKVTSSLNFGDPIRCMAHSLNTVIKKGLCLWVEPKQDAQSFQSNFNVEEWEDIEEDDENDDDDDTMNIIEDPDDVASDLLSEEENENENEKENNSISDDDDDDNNVDGVDIIDNGSVSDTDIDYQLNSLNLNDYSSSSIDHFKLLNDIFQLMKKTRLLVKYIRNHTSINDYVNKYTSSSDPENKMYTLVADMSIRWNSTFLLLARLLLNKDAIRNIFTHPNNIYGLTEKQKKKLKEFTINQHEWELLNVIKNILSPFLATTSILCGQHYPTMSASYYVYCDLLFFLEPKVDDDSITIAIKQSVRFWFHTHCNQKLPSNQMDIMKVAAFLNPAVYNELDDNHRKSAKKVIFRKLNNTSVQQTTSTSSTSHTTTNNLNPFQKLSMACGRILPTSVTTKKSMTVDEEISTYVKLAKGMDNFQEFWMANAEQLPRLASLVRRVE
ncbi:unnamed protein product, partial [Adineta steineri]